MKLPSKVTSYKDSLLYKFPIVLIELKKNKLSPTELYKKTKKKFLNIGEFCETLDCLYMLRKIDFDEEEDLIYVENNSL